MALVVPLSQKQVAAANRLHAGLRQWAAADRALEALAERFPGFDEVSTLLKAVTINAMYGTNVWALDRMARHIMAVVSEIDLDRTGPELVERVATLPPAQGQKRPRTHLSFASKFAHFFIDADRFPILDSYAAKMVRFHLGKKNLVRHPGHPYVAFVENLRLLRTSASLQCTTRELDHYLWLAGLRREWLDGNMKINVEVRSLFEAASGKTAADLKAMLGQVERGSWTP